MKQVLDIRSLLTKMKTGLMKVQHVRQKIPGRSPTMRLTSLENLQKRRKACVSPFSHTDQIISLARCRTKAYNHFPTFLKPTVPRHNNELQRL